MRQAEIGVAGVLAVFSLYLMWKSAELPIGWVRGVGPGGGAFPFWLSAIMLVCSALIALRAVLRLTAESRTPGPFVHPEARRVIAIVAVALTVMIAAIHVVGVYVAVPLFVLFYTAYIGRHRWWLCLSLTAAIPVVTFLFFEKLLLIILPKGITEEFFYLFY